MKLRIAILLAIAVIVLGPSTASVNADSWELPKKTKYYSPNKKYYLEVTPKKLESQLKYFEDKVGNKENAGALKGVPDNRAKAAFYVRRDDGRYSRRKVFPLVNEVSPVSVVVSNNGDYFVTFDNWHSVGYGDDVVVIYRADGALVKKFGLEELLTEGDIETFRRSVSSMSWGGQHYLDESRGQLVLKVVSNGISAWDEGAKFHELKIDLATARPLEQKRDLFPQPRVLGTIAFEVAPQSSGQLPGEPTCSSPEHSGAFSDAVRIAPEQFFAKAVDRVLPSYPAIAKAAHVEGIVLVEMLVSKSGEVLCARSLSGHPLLRRPAVLGALKWKFEPFQGSGNAVGSVAVAFKLTEKDMNPNNSRKQ